MRNAGLLLLLCISYSSHVFGQMVAYIYLDDTPREVSFEEYFPMVIDPSGELTINDLLQDTSLQPVEMSAIAFPLAPYYAWTSVQLTNHGTQTRNLYFRTYIDMDSVWCYQVYGKQVVSETFTGKSVPIFAKTPAHVKNLFPLQLAVGETRTYYLRFEIDRATSLAAMKRIFTVIPAQPENAFMVKTFVWQSFYLGSMALFCLLSIFMFIVFRERIFLYFGVLTFSFGGYFMSSNRVLDILIRPVGGQDFYLQNLFVGGIVLATTLFIKNYLRLDRHFPRYVFYFVGYAFLIESLILIGFSFFDRRTMAIVHNIHLVVWILICFGPIVVLSWRGNSAAKVLLITIAILVVSALLHLWYLTTDPLNQLAAVSVFQLGTGAFVSVLFYDLFTRINTIRQEKERFQELDTLKSRFFTNISHEFRTPLTLIKGPISQLEKKLPKAEDRKLLNMMGRNADRLLRLINQLLDLSKLEAGEMELQARETEIVALLKGITMSFESLAQRKGISLQFSSNQDNILLWIDSHKLEDILNNLLSNAFKHTPSEGAIRVRVKEEDDHVKIQIKDTGEGIPANQLPSIFNRFFQADQQSADGVQGSGIGLALVKELVNLHGGSIRVSSKEKQGTIFDLRFPKGNTHLSTASLSSPVTEEVTPSTLANSTMQWEEEQATNPVTVLASDRKRHAAPLVLIIEDNADVRYYVKQNLEAEFRIVEAVDGQDGIDKTLAYLPDLIISDVMMPIRNGYEVCRILKTDARTSHIPIILLTAKAAREEKHHGLETGADDYLIKPFDTHELQVRVKNLIDLRKQLRVRFAVGESEAAPLEPSLNSVDKEFMQTVFITLNKDLANEQFGVDDLATATGMSTRHLNRKLKALTDMSANRFIRNYRLQEAMRMLKRKEGNVSEVATATGFSSIAYFVKCFGEKYGQTPGSV